MKLYTIYIRHAAPKDVKSAIVGYLLAENDEEVYNYIDKKLTNGIWGDKENDPAGTQYQQFKKKMLRLRGEYHDKWADFSDAYYGVTHYGWSKGKDVSKEEINVLKKLKMLLKR